MCTQDLGIIGYVHTKDGFYICEPMLGQEEAGGAAGALWMTQEFLEKWSQFVSRGYLLEVDSEGVFRIIDRFMP
jgi:hypothetical protein